jgi:hypothetical protein
MMSTKYVVAIVLAWNHISDTIECIASLLKSNYRNLQITLVDNGSIDGTAGIIVEKFPEVRVLRIENNVGVAQGYNFGLEYAIEDGADYFIVMNNDTIASPGLVSELVRALDSEPEAGMLMPKIFVANEDDNRLWCVGARWCKFPPSLKLIGAGESDSHHFNQVRDLEFAPGCCLLMTRVALEQVGLFDSEYFFYFEDWDLSARFRAGGYKILFIPQAHLWHKVSVSSLKSGKPNQWWYFMGKGSVRFYLTYRNLGILIVHTVWFAMRETVKLNFGKVMSYLRGVAQGLVYNY